MQSIAATPKPTTKVLVSLTRRRRPSGVLGDLTRDPIGNTMHQAIAERLAL
jgi:hypothetical protein